MNKRLFCLAFILAVLCVLLPTAAFAADSGTCGAEGDNLTWTLDDEGTLTISGAGAMADYDYKSPWYSRRLFVRDRKSVV